MLQRWDLGTAQGGTDQRDMHRQQVMPSLIADLKYRQQMLIFKGNYCRFWGNVTVYSLLVTVGSKTVMHEKVADDCYVNGGGGGGGGGGGSDEAAVVNSSRAFVALLCPPHLLCFAFSDGLTSATFTQVLYMQLKNKTPNP